MVEALSNKIEKQKIKAIGARNLLQGMEKQKEHNQQQLHWDTIKGIHHDYRMIFKTRQMYNKISHLLNKHLAY
ncbi:hypothetical protein HUJ05_007948 [Dendroctonus ponderosae]|nr:hypothetical protein HUJ05_007948 [Dendroctonus ponderosae]